MQPQHPALIRAIPDGPWMRAMLAHRKADGRWLAEMENGALAEIGADDIRISKEDAPGMLREIGATAKQLADLLRVLPASARESGYYATNESLLATIRHAADAAQQLEVSA